MGISLLDYSQALRNSGLPGSCRHNGYPEQSDRQRERTEPGHEDHGTGHVTPLS
jgi:hypothetical protein